MSKFTIPICPACGGEVDDPKARSHKCHSGKPVMFKKPLFKDEDGNIEPVKKKKRCSKQVWDRYHAFPCKILGPFVFRKGKWYCRVHDPVAVQQRKRKRDEAYRKEGARMMQRAQDLNVGKWLRENRPKQYKRICKEMKPVLG